VNLNQTKKEEKPKLKKPKQKMVGGKGGWSPVLGTARFVATISKYANQKPTSSAFLKKEDMQERDWTVRSPCQTLEGRTKKSEPWDDS